MKAISAHVRNGQIIPDEPIELLEGAAVEILLPDPHPQGHGMTDEEMEDLDAALDESRAQFARGEYEDARALLLRLAARS